jgi:prepilin-type N-terminal cleavage/methylation domain-containing protein/prepilin-type processing-associated H-X9-DG protein
LFRFLGGFKMGSCKRAFTLIELLVVIAIIAILAAILFPVFAQARASARAISCVSNTKQFSLGILMYAQDYDESIPRLDNNMWDVAPNWGDPGSDPLEPNAMFAGVVQPYMKNTGIQYCPESGRTNWRAAMNDTSWELNGGSVIQPYVAALDSKGIYDGTYSPQAVNWLLVEGYPGSGWDAVGHTASGGNIGQMAGWSRPAELVLVTGDTVWWYTGTATTLPIGNSGVWPAGRPNEPHCGYGGNPYGWTWYIHRASTRSGNPPADPNLWDKTGITTGRANVSLGDGHVKSFTFNNLERCDFNTGANLWTWSWWDPRY